MVFVSHYPVPLLGGWARQVTEAGYAGVTFFFVLSGFILTYNYVDEFEKGIDLALLIRYFVARFARIYPLYFFFISLGWLTQPSSGAPFWTYALALQTWSSDLGVAYGINGPAWSIGVELFLYLCFPILISICLKLGLFRSRGTILLSASLVAAAMIAIAVVFVLTGQSQLPSQDPLSAHRWLYRTPLLRLGDFVLGMLGAVYVMRFAQHNPQRSHIPIVAHSVLVATIIALMGMKSNHYSALSWDVAFAIPGALLIASLARWPTSGVARPLASAPAVLLGEASYAFYLAHMPAGPIRGVTSLQPLSELVLYAMFVALVISLSIGLHVAIEKPARKLIRRLMP